MLPLSRRYILSPYFSFEKNAHNCFLGDFVGPSINLLPFIVNIHSKGGMFFYLKVLLVLQEHWKRLQIVGFFFLPFFWQNVCAFLSGNFLFIIIVYLSLLYVLIKFFILECNFICGASCLQFRHKKLHPIPMSPSGPVNFVPGLSTFCVFCLFELSFNLGS